MTIQSVQAADQMQSVIEMISALDASVLERLRGDALLTGPPDWRRELPASAHTTAQRALAEALTALERRLEQIAPMELVQQRHYDPPVRDAYPWCYLDFIVEAKVLSIVGEGHLGEDRLSQLRRPWAAVRQQSCTTSIASETTMCESR